MYIHDYMHNGLLLYIYIIYIYIIYIYILCIYIYIVYNNMYIYIHMFMAYIYNMPNAHLYMYSILMYIE